MIDKLNAIKDRFKEVSNLIKINELTKLPNLIKDLKKPKSIIFVFYEGNDLNDNINDLKLRNPRYSHFQDYGTIEKKSFNSYLDQISRVIIEKNRLGTYTHKSDVLLFLKILRTAI